MKNNTRILVLLLFVLITSINAELVAHYNFEDGYKVKSESDRLPDADASNIGSGGIVVDPTRGNVLRLEGDGFLDCGKSPEFNIKKELTISAWINPDADENYEAIVCKGTEWRLEQNGVATFAVGSYSLESSSTINLRYGEWHHLVAVYNGVAMALYLDGEWQGSLYSPEALLNQDASVQIGARSGTYKFKGLIDDVIIYNEAITEERISKIMKGDAIETMPEELIGFWDFEGTEDNWFDDKTLDGVSATCINGTPQVINDPERG